MILIYLTIIPDNVEIDKATSQLHLNTTWGSGGTSDTLEANNITTYWVEGTGTAWNNNLTTGTDWTYRWEEFGWQW